MRRRLAGVVDISISQSKQTAAVSFVPGTRVFSAAAFRGAVGEADVDVVSLDVDVCGVVDDQNILRSSTDVQQPFVRLRGDDAPAGSAICVTGRLEEGPELSTLAVTKVLP